MNKNKPLFVIGGASGGHLFPALAVIQELEETYQVSSVLIVPEKARKLLVQHSPHAMRCEWLPHIRLSWNLIPFLWVFLKAWGLFVSYRPQGVVGFGSGISAPFIVIAALLRIPVVIHEQNAVFGMANRYLRFCANRVLLSFPMHEYAHKESYIVTGNPLHYRVLQYSGKDAHDRALVTGKVKIVIVGGSQGATFLNTVVLDAFSLCTPEEKRKMYVFHIAGSSTAENEVRTKYHAVGVEADVFSFCNDMGKLYQQADLIISRAGAGSIFEILAFHLPAILIPYPFAHGHQVLNARHLGDRGAAQVYEQKNLSAHILKNAIMELIHNEDLRNSMRSRCRLLASTHAHERVAGEIVAVIYRKKVQKRREK